MHQWNCKTMKEIHNISENVKPTRRVPCSNRYYCSAAIIGFISCAHDGSITTCILEGKELNNYLSSIETA